MIIKAYKDLDLIKEIELDDVDFYDLGLIKLSDKYKITSLTKQESSNSREAFKLRKKRRIKPLELETLKQKANQDEMFIINIMLSDYFETTEVEKFYYIVKELEYNEISSFIYELLNNVNRIIIKKSFE